MPSAPRSRTQAPAPTGNRAPTQPVSPPRRTLLERLNEVVPTGAPAPEPSASAGPDPFNGRSFRLDVVNAAEDIPRLVRGFVKVGGVECALVLRPADNQGLLIHAQDGQAWKWVGLQADVPARPEEPLAPRDALALLKGAQTQVPAQGPVTLRGMWSGKISCDRGQPRITLQRKVASYGTLLIWSDAHARLWFWRVERAQKWFTRAGQLEGNAETLVVAIQQGLASAMGLLGEACSVRDSRRRAALDSEYAEAHPIRPAREGKDPTEKFKVKEPKPPKTPSSRGRKAATAPAQATGAPALTGSPSTPPLPSGTTSASIPSSVPRRTRAPRQSAAAMPAPAPGPVAPDLGEIDPAKDKLLLDAFGDAISKALANLG